MGQEREGGVEQSESGREGARKDTAYIMVELNEDRGMGVTQQKI